MKLNYINLIKLLACASIALLNIQYDSGIQIPCLTLASTAISFRSQIISNKGDFDITSEGLITSYLRKFCNQFNKNTGKFLGILILLLININIKYKELI